MSAKAKRKNPEVFEFPTPSKKSKLPPLSAKTPSQERLIRSLCNNTITFALGSAGTGKTYVAARMAAEFLEAKDVEKIAVTRPMVDCEEKMGFLPGPPEQKFAPFFAPVHEVLDDHFGGSHLSAYLKNKKVEIAPLAFMRGRSFKNTFVILDEAQNVTPGQMKMFLTRLGEGCIVCISGDPRQVDLPAHIGSGLPDAVQKLEGIDDIGIINMARDEVVRSGVVQRIVEAYEGDD